jgi:hypothetical protein
MLQQVGGGGCDPNLASRTWGGPRARRRGRLTREYLTHRLSAARRAAQRDRVHPDADRGL